LSYWAFAWFVFNVISKKLRVIDADVCNSCKTKDCISKSNHYNFVGRSCTSELYPAELKDNRACIMCGQCHKSCTHNNIAIQKRQLAADLFTDIKLSWAEISFFLIITGFVVYEILSEWKVTKSILMAVPNSVNETVNISAISGTIKAIILFVIFPIAFYFMLAYLKKIFAKETFKQSFTHLVIAILPITASMHLVKAILKTTSRIPYWDYVFTDPKGVDTATKIMENSDYLDKTFLNLITPYLSVLTLLLPIGGLVLSLLIIRKQKTVFASKIISVIAVVFYASIFIITLIAWRFL